MTDRLIHVADIPAELPAGTTLIDVREQHEWDAGHAPNAIHLPMSELMDRVDEIPEGQLYLVCHGGGRSGRVTAWLNDNGHDAVNVAGGMVDWEANGRPMVAEGGATPTVI